ncbi:helicase Cas3 [Peptococcaceae bacterium CEB3]|nr:helicase Cas3 [Peptococcaceae bacterium CEB3]
MQSCNPFYSHPNILLTQHVQNMLASAQVPSPFEENQVDNLVERAIKLHDDGKKFSLFQARMKRVMMGYPTTSRHPLDQHSRISALWAFKELVRTDLENQDIFKIVEMILGHHTGLICDPQQAYDVLSRYAAQVKLQDDLWDELGFSEDDRERLKKIKSAESHRIFQLEEEERRCEKIYLQQAFSRLVDVDRLSAERQGGFEVADTLPFKHGQEIAKHRLEKSQDLTNNNLLSNVRAMVEKELLSWREQPPVGIYSVGLPTGVGKTLVALQLAEWWTAPAVIVAPYMALLDQTEKVLLADAKVSHEGVIVDHHLSLPSQEQGCGRTGKNEDEAEDEEYHDVSPWTETERWHGKFTLTTTVRFFEDLFSMKPTDLRKWHNTYGATIVLDEPQSIPTGPWLGFTKLLPLWVEAYQWRVVLLSATLPKQPEGTIPLIKAPVQTLSRTQIALYPKILEESEEDVTQWAQLAQTCTDNAAEALWMLNTVNRAQAVYNQAQVLYKDSTRKIEFISGELCPLHRAVVYNRIESYMGKGTPFVLVSTTAIEAGVDYDFQAIIRELAPLPNCIQAAGRLNRKGNSETKTLWIIETKGPTEPYSARDISLTREILNIYDKLIPESDYTKVVGEYYQNATRDRKILGEQDKVLEAFDKDEPIKLIKDDIWRESVVINILPSIFGEDELREGWKRVVRGYPYQTAQDLYTQWEEIKKVRIRNPLYNKKRETIRLLGLYMANLKTKRIAGTAKGIKIRSTGYGVSGANDVVDTW